MNEVADRANMAATGDRYLKRRNLAVVTARLRSECVARCIVVKWQLHLRNAAVGEAASFAAKTILQPGGGAGYGRLRRAESSRHKRSKLRVRNARPSCGRAPAKVASDLRHPAGRRRSKLGVEPRCIPVKL